MGTFFLLRLISALTPTNSQHTTTTTTATPPSEHIPPVCRFQRQSLLLCWNQCLLADATPQPPYLPAGVHSGSGRGVGARSGAPGGERFLGGIDGPHHDAGVLLAVRGRGKWRLEQEDKMAGRDERRSWRDSCGWGVATAAQEVCRVW